MEKSDLEKGLEQLNELARAEYREDLAQLINNPAETPQEGSLRIGRLIGVMMKEPFAIPETLPSPSQHSRAYRAWHLVDQATFNQPSRQKTWQFQSLKEILNEVGQPNQSVYGLAQDAHYERGFFGYLARSTAKYICGDPKIRDKAKEALAEAKSAGINVNITSPNVIVGSAGLSLGALLVQSVPVLGLVGAPVIAGLVLIIYLIGVDAFCQWVKDNQPVADSESR